MDLAGLSFVMRGKDYQLLDRAEIQARLHLPPDQQFSRPESGLVRTLYDCPDVAMGTSGLRCRVVIATHPSGPTKHRIGVERDGVVYELFLTDLPQSAFTAADVVALYLHRGAFENALADPKTWSWTRIAGVVMRHVVKNYGTSSASGSGTFAWNWVTSLLPNRCARPSLLLPSQPTQTEATPSRGYRSAEVALRRTRWSLLGARLHSSARWHVTLSRLRSHW